MKEKYEVKGQQVTEKVRRSHPCTSSPGSSFFTRPHYSLLGPRCQVDATCLASSQGRDVVLASVDERHRRVSRALAEGRPGKVLSYALVLHLLADRGRWRSYTFSPVAGVGGLKPRRS